MRNGQLGFASELMNALRKIERMVLVLVNVMIALRVAGRLRGTWE
jgi:hypothetical protein